MPSITIRNIDNQLKARLRVRAARNARSMEEEARVILREAVATDAASPTNLAASIAECFQALGGVELELPPREPMREPPKFGR
jgi:plasmid stability protein